MITRKQKNTSKKNQFAQSPIANTLKKHKSWCYNPNDSAYIHYGAKGRRIAEELLYTSDPSVNEQIILAVLNKIGEKPGPDYHLHVDWEATGDLMTLDNLSWVPARRNIQMRHTYNIRCEQGRYLCIEAEKNGVNPKTASARYRKGYSIAESISSQLRPDINFSAQQDKFQAINELILSGELFANTAGEVFRIFPDRSFHKLKGRVVADRYRYVRLDIGHKKVWAAISHIVLIQYAGLPPYIKKDGVWPVWTAEHIDSNPHNNSSENLAWMLHSHNSRFRASKKAKINYKATLSMLAKNDVVILTSYSRSPLPDNFIDILEDEALQSRKLFQRTWKLGLQLGWLQKPKHLMAALAKHYSQCRVPLDFLTRIALAPGNNMRIEGERIYVTSPTSQRERELSEISPNNDADGWKFCYFSEEVREKLKSMCGDNCTLIWKLTEPLKDNHFIVLPETITVRTQLTPSIDGKRTCEVRSDHFKQMSKSLFNNSILTKNPELAQYVQFDANGELVNPLLVRSGSSSIKIRPRCANCLALALPTAVKSFAKKTKSGRCSRGSYCCACLAKNRAENGTRNS